MSQVSDMFHGETILKLKSIVSFSHNVLLHDSEDSNTNDTNKNNNNFNNNNSNNNNNNGSHSVFSISLHTVMAIDIDTLIKNI
jgi:hypothetical protein